MEHESRHWEIKREVDTREAIKRQIYLRNQICLEHVQINIQRTIETQRSSFRQNDLGDQPVQVDETWRADAKIFLANIINGLIVVVAFGRVKVAVVMCGHVEMVVEVVVVMLMMLVLVLVLELVLVLVLRCWGSCWWQWCWWQWCWWRWCWRWCWS